MGGPRSSGSKTAELLWLVEQKPEVSSLGYSSFTEFRALHCGKLKIKLICRNEAGTHCPAVLGLLPSYLLDHQGSSSLAQGDNGIFSAT